MFVADHGPSFLPLYDVNVVTGEWTSNVWSLSSPPPARSAEHELHRPPALQAIGGGDIDRQNVEASPDAQLQNAGALCLLLCGLRVRTLYKRSICAGYKTGRYTNWRGMAYMQTKQMEVWRFVGMEQLQCFEPALNIILPPLFAVTPTT